MNGYCGEQHLITTGDSRHRRREDEPSSSSQLQLVANIVAKTNKRFHFFPLPDFTDYSESRSSRTKHIFVQRSLWNSFCWNLLIAVCGRAGATVVDRNFKHDALSGAVKQERPTRFSVAERSERSRLFGVWRCQRRGAGRTGRPEPRRPRQDCSLALLHGVRQVRSPRPQTLVGTPLTSCHVRSLTFISANEALTSLIFRHTLSNLCCFQSAICFYFKYTLIRFICKVHQHECFDLNFPGAY